MSDPALTPSRPAFVSAEDGERVWFLDTLMIIRAGAEHTGGALGLVDCLLPPGFGPPLHVHHDEDQALYVLEGELLLAVGEERFRAGPGAFVFKPRGVAHGFRVLGQTPARVLEMDLPAGIEALFRDAGRPAAGPGLPPPEPLDVSRLKEVHERHHIEVVGPPIEA